MRSALTDIAALGGAGCLIAAGFIIWPPLGLGLTGIALLLGAVALARSES